MGHKKVTVLAFILVLVLLGFGLRNHSIPLSADPYAVYQSKAKSASTPRTDFRFVDQSSLIGSRQNDPHDVYTISNVVGDFDGDGYEDILLVNFQNEDARTKIKLLKNNRGEHFQDVTADRLDLPQSIDAISAVALVDLDNDGRKDLYIARFMKPHLALKNINGSFSFNHQIPVDPIHQPTRGIYLLDYNRDGFVDLYLSSFSTSVYSLLFNDMMAKTEVDFPVRNKSGSHNILLRNQAGKQMVAVEKALGAEDGGFTWAVGIDDFNGDGFPDLYVANDFGYDRLYLNQEGKNFVDRSEQVLGKIRSENAMGAEIADVDNSGVKGIYISNASKPGLQKGWNHFWRVEAKKDLHFSDEAKKFAIDKCGFSWGSRFVDINKDGLMDLLVVNGRTGRPNDNTNRWYYRQYEWNLPPFLKFLPEVHVPHGGYNFAQGESNCFFLNNGHDFDDVAESVGLTDQENGRSVTAIDVQNSGQESFVIGNYMHDPFLYKTDRSNKNQWLGLMLEGTKSNRDGIGAQVKLKTEKWIQQRSLYPSNGFASQTSLRLIFGLPENQKTASVEVTWPSGKVTTREVSQFNRYITIKE